MLCYGYDEGMRQKPPTVTMGESTQGSRISTHVSAGPGNVMIVLVITFHPTRLQQVNRRCEVPILQFLNIASRRLHLSGCYTSITLIDRANLSVFSAHQTPSSRRSGRGGGFNHGGRREGGKGAGYSCWSDVDYTAKPSRWMHHFSRSLRSLPKEWLNNEKY